LLAIGDAAAFIDPFTGSGMLMAFESGELAATVILRNREKLTNKESLASLETQYAKEYARKFGPRLRISGVLRHAAFKPRLAGLGIALCSLTEQLRNRLARATRSSTRNDLESPA
jgi:flavin-dependent dehydrogenase